MEILFKIFRDVPLHNKINLLWDMPEIKHILQDRGAYLNSPHPFSIEYLELLRSIRPGWYVHCTNSHYRVCVQINERTLQITFFHFGLLYLGKDYKLNARYGEGSLSIDNIKQYVRGLLQKFDALEEIEHFLYHLKGYGVIVVENTTYPPKIHMYEGSKYNLERHVPRTVLDPHFEVMWTCDAKLIVECKLTEQHVCRCEELRYQLSPCTVETTPEFTQLTLNGGTFPLIGRQDFLLGKGHQVETYKIFHVNFNIADTLPFEECDPQKRKRFQLMEDKPSKHQKTD